MTLPANVLTLTLDGLDLLGRQADGTRITTESLDGWGSPASTIQLVQRPGAHGAWAGDAFLEARDIAIGGILVAQDRLRAVTTFDLIQDACALTDVAFVVDEGGLERTILVRRTGRILHRWETESAIRWSLQMVALDPRKTMADMTGSTGLPASTGGLRVPFRVPFRIESATVAGQITLTNPGNIAGHMVIRIDGPVTAPRVTHVSSGKVLVFASSMSLAAGEWVVIDMDAKTVLANGTASRNGWVTSREWFSFEPGINVIAVSAAAHSEALFTVTGTPSWG